jgi:serine/threonine protein kinase
VADAVKHLGPLSEAQAGCVMLQALDAVDHLHAHGVVHRDLKLAK